MGTAPTEASGLATLADLLAIPEHERHHELLEGTLLDKGAASAKHGEAQLSLGILLRPFRRGGIGGPGGWIFASEVEVFFEPHNTLRPDVSGWRRERMPALPDEVPVRLIPDWICEILSTNRANDLVRKKRIYHQHRVQHYWVVDPEAEMLTVYRHERDGYLEALVAVRGERVRAEPFDAIELPVGVLFGDDEG